MGKIPLSEVKDLLDNSKDISFDHTKVEKVRPKLANTEGYALSAEELKSIFGIQPRYFAEIPKRIVVPVLQGGPTVEQWHYTNGWLYVLEPLAWVPVVLHGRTIPASNFETSVTIETTTTMESKFNASAKAEVSFEGGGSFFGVKAKLKSSAEISLDRSGKTATKEELIRKGITGNEAIHELQVYPILRCRAIKKQKIDYTINHKSSELKWTPESYQPGYWEKRKVESFRVRGLEDLQFHPVPVDGHDARGDLGYLLPVPQLQPNGDLKFATLLSRKGWSNWWFYDEHDFEDVEETVDLAAPNNSGAFQAMKTWTTLPPLER